MSEAHPNSTPAQKPTKITKFLCQLAGDSVPILEACDQREWNKSASRGATLFVPPIIAGTGSGYTAYSFSESWIASLSIGLTWAAMVLVVDRAILTHFKTGKFVLVQLLPRMILALLTSLVTSHPFVFLLFSDELDARIERNRRHELTEIRHETDQQITTTLSAYGPRTTQLQGRIESTRKELAQLAVEQNQAAIRLTDFEQQYHDEISGRGPSGKPGIGTRAKQLWSKHIDPLKVEIVALDKQRQTMSQSLDQLDAELSGHLLKIENDPIVSRLREQQTRLEAFIEQAPRRDLLAKWRTLHEIMEEDSMTLCAYLAICGLLLMFETIPLLVKLTDPRGEYARAIEKREFEQEQRLADFVSGYPVSEAVRQELQARFELASERLEFHRRLAAKILDQADQNIEQVAEKRRQIPRRAPEAQKEAMNRTLESLLLSYYEAGEQTLRDLQPEAGA